jgi:hypothetical protein
MKNDSGKRARTYSRLFSQISPSPLLQRGLETQEEKSPFEKGG